MADVHEVLRDALALEVHERATVAETLLASQEELSEEETERLWAEEAERRLERYRSGRAKAIPAVKYTRRPKDSSGDDREVSRSGRSRVPRTVQ